MRIAENECDFADSDQFHRTRIRDSAVLRHCSVPSLGHLELGGQARNLSSVSARRLIDVDSGECIDAGSGSAAGAVAAMTPRRAEQSSHSTTAEVQLIWLLCWDLTTLWPHVSSRVHSRRSAGVIFGERRKIFPMVSICSLGRPGGGQHSPQ